MNHLNNLAKLFQISLTLTPPQKKTLCLQAALKALHNKHWETLEKARSHLPVLSYLYEKQNIDQKEVGQSTSKVITCLESVRR